MSSISNASTLDGFPKEFVTAMRKLFDIMDDKKTGYVNLSDIENRWHDDGAKGLPKGVIESLRKVTPSDGLLSFERFCAGLKICLLRSQVEQHNQMRLKQAQENLHHHQSPNNGRPPSAPLLDVGDGAPKRGWSAASLLIKSTDVLNHRTISMPHLNPDKKKIGPQQQQDASMQAHFGPPKPPRSALLESRGNFDKSEIRAALQNWQIGRLAGGGGGHPPNLKAARSLGDGKASSQNVPLMGVYQKKTSAKRREPRRHTLQNGIDYNMLKRIKQIEQEKEVLVQGLAAIERAREWYLNQIATTQEKMKYLGRMGHPEHLTEAQHERLELQRARVYEVNRHLAALTDSWERGGLPLHMNLALNHYSHPQDLTSRLKQQNHLLKEELSKKNEKILALEKEKANLIRDLIQRGTTKNLNAQEVVF